MPLAVDYESMATLVGVYQLNLVQLGELPRKPAQKPEGFDEMQDTVEISDTAKILNEQDQSQAPGIPTQDTDETAPEGGG